MSSVAIGFIISVAALSPAESSRESPDSSVTASDKTGPQPGHLRFQAVETKDGPLLKVSVANIAFLTPRLSFQHESQQPTTAWVVNGEVRVTVGEKILDSGEIVELSVQQLNYHAKPTKGQELVRGIKRNAKNVQTKAIGPGDPSRPEPDAILFQSVKVSDDHVVQVTTADIVFQTSEISFQRHKKSAVTIGTQEGKLRVSNGDSLTTAGQIQMKLKSLSEGILRPVNYSKPSMR